MKKELKESLKKRVVETVKDKDEYVSVKNSVLNFEESNRSVKTYSLKKGENSFDIIPYKVTTDWYKNLRQHSNRPTGVEKGLLDYKLEIPVHRLGEHGENPILCLKFAFGKKCSICEEKQKQRELFDQTGASKYEAEWKRLSPKWRVFYTINIGESKKIKLRLLEASFHLFEKYLKDASERG